MQWFRETKLRRAIPMLGMLLLASEAVAVGRSDRPPKLTLSMVERLAESDGPHRVWVFFADKGFATDGERLEAIESVRTSYNLRSVERRRLRGDHAARGGPLFDFRDLPVRDRYAASVSATGARVRIRSRWLNALSAVASSEQIEAIAALPFVTRIQPVARVRPPKPVDVGESAPPRARESQAPGYGRSTDQLSQINLIAMHQAGYTGSGVVIGILDTGFRRDHDAFNQPGHTVQVLAEYDFVDDDPDTSNEPGDPASQHNHGTLILGTIGTYHPGELVGGAFGASFILCKTEDTTDEYQGEEDNFVAGLEFIEAQGGDMATSSLGYIDWYTQADLDGETAVTTIAVNAASSLGLHIVTAAGNEYHDSDPATSSLIAPSDAFEIITAGAVTSSGTITSFSSDGPTADGRVKPEVLALGSGTQTVSPSSTTSFTSASGTSLSTPLVACAVACLIQAHPTWSVDHLREELFRNADYDPGGFGYDPQFVLGYGIIDAMATHLNATGLQVGPNGNSVVEGPVGGPFVPASITFTLSNDSDFPIDYSVTADVLWLNVAGGTGTIAANAYTDVVVSPDAQAAGLGWGLYDAALDFVNLTDHDGDATRAIALYVGMVPSERITLLVEGSQLVWAQLAGALAYDIVKGDLDILRATAGDFAAATQQCVAYDVTDTYTAFTETPDPGEGIWILVRGQDATGPMTYDSVAASQAAPRDGGIASSGVACP